MGEEEASLEVIRSVAYQKSIRVTTVCIYLASFVAALGLIFLAYYIFHEMKLRDPLPRRAELLWCRIQCPST
jgi:hypothetical protein